MELSLCKSDLTPRQMLWGILSECEDIRGSLIECCICDSPLFYNDHFLEAVKALKIAQREISQLRGLASPETLGSLSSKIVDLSSFIHSI